MGRQGDPLSDQHRISELSVVVGTWSLASIADRLRRREVGSVDAAGAIGRVRVEMVVGPGSLDQLQDWLNTFWSQHDQVPPLVRIEVGLAVAEVAANIVEHGDAKWLRIQMHAGLTQILADVNDDGSAVDVDLAAVAMPDELAERGRGLALVKLAMGLFSYRRDDSGNHWNMISHSFDRG